MRDKRIERRSDQATKRRTEIRGFGVSACSLPAAAGRFGVFAAPAFTLIEMMVVMGIIVVLVGAIFAVSKGVIDGGRERNTAALLLQVQEAVDEFQRAAPLAKVRSLGFTMTPNDVSDDVSCQSRYGNYPPDELAIFTTKGVDSNADGMGADDLPNITPGGGHLGGDVVAGITNQSLKAMILAIRTFSPSGSMMLDRIDARYRRVDDMANTLKPPVASVEYLDRDAAASAGYGAGDIPLEVIVDAWGQPLEYLAVRVPRTAPIPTQRNRVSNDWVNANNGVPVLMSYGPDGPDQFDSGFINNSQPPDYVVDDWEGNDGTLPDKLDNPLNADNVFTSPALKKRLLEGGA